MINSLSVLVMPSRNSFRENSFSCIVVELVTNIVDAGKSSGGSVFFWHPDKSSLDKKRFSYVLDTYRNIEINSAIKLGYNDSKSTTLIWSLHLRSIVDKTPSRCAINVVVKSNSLHWTVTDFGFLSIAWRTVLRYLAPMRYWYQSALGLLMAVRPLS